MRREIDIEKIVGWVFIHPLLDFIVVSVGNPPTRRAWQERKTPIVLCISESLVDIGLAISSVIEWPG